MAIQGQFKQDAPRFNSIINGDMVIWQRGTTITDATTATTNADDSYIADRWVLLSDGNNIVDVTRSTDAPDGGSKNSCALDVETANKKFGIVQLIEQVNCHDMLGETVSLTFKARASSVANFDDVRCAIIAWSGTADAMTSDVVSAWAVEGTNPTLVTSWTYENTPADLNITTSWAEYKIENVAIDTAGATNIAVFIYSNVTGTTIGEIIYITDVMINKGTTAGAFERKSFNTVEYECLRYYETSMTWGTTGQYAGQRLVRGNSSATFGATVGNVDGIRLRHRKRATPTFTIYHQDGTAGAIYGPVHTGAKTTGVAAQHTMDLGCLFVVKASAFVQGGTYYYAYTAESEL